jgi:hypothetical protein
MALPEPYRSRLPLIGSRIIAFESRNPGSVRMRINPDSQKIAAAAKDLQEQGFKKRLLQSPQQFVFDSVLSYQAAIEMWLPFAELHHLVGDRVQICFGFGAYCGWQGPLKAVDFDAERGMRMLLLFDIAPVFSEISDLLDPIKSKNEPSQKA